MLSSLLKIYRLLRELVFAAENISAKRFVGSSSKHPSEN